MSNESVEQVLESASKEEAELAGIARACIIAALDHSNAEVIRLSVTLDKDGGQRTPDLLLPPRALRFFADVLQQMAKREPVLLVPQKHELTTQEAAAFLNVSRPFVIKEIAAGKLACRHVNRHRRIEFQELVRYRKVQKKQSELALEELNRLSREMGEAL
jgi:excisionase family DNA binding protein